MQLGLLTPEEARKSLSFFGQDAMIHQSVRNYNYALDLLEAALAGDEIVVMRTDPVKEILEVFQEYSTSDSFQELPDEIQAAVQSVLISIMAQGNPQAAAQISQPLYPIQQPQQQQPGMGFPGQMQPSADAAAGGTPEGAAQRTENQNLARTYEGFDPRAGGGM